MQPLRAPSAAIDTTPQPVAAAMAHAPMPHPPAPVMPPPVLPRPSSTLFATPNQPAPPAPPRAGLFGLVTGAMRRPAPAAAQEPPPVAAPPAPTPRYAPPAADETGLDIPAFLRRQSS
jgi:cell division protein FtsZ